MSTSSMKDVAQHAGVSIATVSHVINNTRFVKEETRQKVLDSIKQLNYQPNALARSFKTGRHNLIAFISPDIANPFFSTLIEEIEAVISPEGYRLVICNTKEDPKKEADSLQALGNGMVDGFIIASAFTDYRDVARYIPAGIPTIFLDRHLKNCPCDTIRIDSYPAIREGMEYLINQGHTRIGCFSVHSEISTARERLEAYQDAMAAHHLPGDGAVFLGTALYRLFAKDLSMILDKGYTAIVASNNALTAAVLPLLIKNGYTPGKDIEVLGFQESEQPQYIAPDIHMIHFPTEALGQAAGRQILERLKNPDLPVRQTILSATFQPRG